MGKRLKILLIWGGGLFIVNNIIEFFALTFLGLDGGRILTIPLLAFFNVIASYRGALASNKVSFKGGKNYHPAINGIGIVLFAALLDTIYLYFLSGGNLEFSGFPIIWGAIGGLFAQRKLQGKPLWTWRLK